MSTLSLLAETVAVVRLAKLQLHEKSEWKERTVNFQHRWRGFPIVRNYGYAKYESSTDLSDLAKVIRRCLQIKHTTQR